MDARVEGESTKGSLGQKPGDDVPSAVIMFGTCADARVEGESTKGAPGQEPGDDAPIAADTDSTPAGAETNVSGISNGSATTRRPHPRML